MATAQKAAHHRGRWLRRVREASRTWKRLRELLLWYWALSLPRRGQLVRPAYLQPLAGALLALIGLPAVLLEYLPLSAGLILSLCGLVLVDLSYLISRAYHAEYPGRFNPQLEEYVARRVSRLSKDQFIPQYSMGDHAGNSQICALDHQVRQALRVELRRLEQSERTTPSPVCGVLVVGPKQSNKTGALWHAMAHELKGWTFVQWPHHMDHPANLARLLGHHVVLWVDNLHDFAHPGEAASLALFVQQVRDEGRQILVLASCRDEHDLQEAERYFRALMLQQRRVLVKEPLQLEQQRKESGTAYENLPPDQKSVLEAMHWLQSARVLTFPYQVLRVLYPNFLHREANQEGLPRWEDTRWEDTVSALSQNKAKFVRSEQRADAQTRLREGPYNFVDWLRYNLLNNLPRPDKVVVPVNIHYLDLENSRSASGRAPTAARTDTLKQKPETVIQSLAAHPVAAETLILLGDAYLSHLGEDLDNASELAIKCYEAALQQLDTDTSPSQFPGAWAAALVGKGNAELREGRAQSADATFRRVTEHNAPTIPTTLFTRAWHGRGDAAHAAAAQATDDEVPRYLEAAAEYYEQAAQKLAPGDSLWGESGDPLWGELSDPLWGETKLDRANVLYELAEAAARRHEQRHAVDEIKRMLSACNEARKAYQEAQKAYSQTVAPAAWAEIQRRHGELWLMEAKCFLPAAGNIDVVVNSPPTDQKEAPERAKKARNYFVAAEGVFAPSYLPVSWSRTQLGLARALLIIAPAAESHQQAWDVYSLCLETTKAAATQVSTLAQAPLDWVDLQLLRAEAEIDRARLDEGGDAPHYREAASILNKTGIVLTEFERIPGNPRSERMKGQEHKVRSMRQRLTQISTES